MAQTTFSATDFLGLSIAEIAPLIRNLQLSPVEVTERCLERISQLDPLLNSFITVTSEQAMAEAHLAESELVSGRWRGPLHGVPVALKDLIDVAGVPTTAASNVLRKNVPTVDAPVVRRLRSAGAILLGKLNLHEFAYGGSGLISAYGAAKNPICPERTTGGSSSGSAAAVAAHLCFAALGTDTAGSIRLPSACCGLVGHKPTYGLVSTDGVIPLSWSFDHVGPITRTVRDAEIMMSSLAGQTFGFPRTIVQPEREPDTAALRLGIVRDFFFDEIDPGVERCFGNAVKTLTGHVREIKETTIPVDTDRTVSTAESYAYHERFLPAQSGEYQPATLQRILSGRDTSMTTYVEKRRELDLLRGRTRDIFTDVDVLLTPTVPIEPPLLSGLTDMATLRRHELLMLRNTRPFNVLGLPSVTVPCGTTGSGCPVGLQITGSPGADYEVLRLAHLLEQLLSPVGGA